MEVRAPDIVVYNGKVVTVDTDFHIHQAFAIEGEKFVAVGSDVEIKSLAGTNTQMIDLKGATVTPGFADSHDHLFNPSRYMWRGVDMIGVTSATEMQSRLRKAVETAEPGQVVFTTIGWAVTPAPTRSDLDQLSTEIPIIVIGSRRAVTYNSAALKLAGISKDNPVFAGMPLPVSPSGELTGASPGFPASALLLDKLLPMTAVEEEDVIIRGWHERHALGITSIRELSVWPDIVQAYYRVWRKGKLTGRVALGIEFSDSGNTSRNLELMGIAVGFGDHWLRIDSTGEEPWVPGAMAKQPYIDLMLALNRLGWRPAPHASADRQRGTGYDDAANETLEAFEAADRVDSIKEKRWYIEHVPFATPEQIDRIAKLGLIVSIQDSGYHAALPNYPPEKERRDHTNPVRSFLDKGLLVIGGSDNRGPSPHERTPNNPFIFFSFYVTRKAKDGTLCAPTEKIGRDEALRIFTSNAAYATFEEKLKGSIEPGKLADFVILSQDILTVPDDQILQTKVLATFVGGNNVYSAPAAGFESAAVQALSR